MLLELPHTAGCLVCGRDNPHGLHLCSFVNPDTGIVTTAFMPAPHHIGFVAIIHGGVLTTVADELMVWCAIWASRKACVAAELSMRFIQKATVGQLLQVSATINRHRSRLIETTAEIRHGRELICTATGKYIPLGPADTADFMKTLIDEPATIETIRRLTAEIPV